ncbi:MAG: WD40 repeat domain-containing protein [Chloroflexi bacterium]|nr:WD40 repeat domain-containing protein [Chloroflexota bacterium]MBP8058882.1 WD40 repeat domain-containing protein [Chloroflexota bacterium]
MADYKRELRQKIADHFDTGELKTLCQDLDIRYADLPAQGHEEKVGELVDYCNRHNRLKDLMKRCHEERPHVNWPEIPTALAPTPQKSGSVTPTTPIPDSRTGLLQKLPPWAWGALALVLIFGIVFLVSSLTETLATLSTPDAIFPNLVKITSDNANALTEINRFGKGTISGDVAYSPDGTTIALPALGGVYLYNAETFEEELFVSAGDDNKWAVHVTFSPSGNLLAFAYGDAYELRVWDMTTGEFLSVSSAVEAGHAHSLIFISDDLLAVGSHNQVYFWHSSNDELVNSVDTLAYQIEDVAFSPDGKLMAVGNNPEGTVELWEVSQCITNRDITCKRRNEPTELRHNVQVQEVEFSPDGQFLASASYEGASGEGSLQIWNVSACLTQQEGTCATPVYDSMADDIADVLSIDFSSDNVLAGSVAGPTARLWQYDGSNWGSSYQQQIYGGNSYQTLFSPDEETLLFVTGNDSLFFLYPENDDDVIARQNLEIDEHWDAQSLAFSQDGTTAILGSSNRTVRVLSLTDKQFTSVFEVPTGWVDSVSVSPDGNMIVVAVGNHASTYLWFTNDANHYCQLDKDFMVSAFSPDGTKIVGGADDGKWHIWSLENLSSDCSPESPALASFPTSVGNVSATITAITFSPDGAWIATGHEDGSVWVWDAGNGKLQSGNISQGHNHWVRSVAFSPDGLWLASTSGEQNEAGAYDEGSIRLWHFNSETGQIETSDELVIGQLHTAAVNSALFSPDSTLLVSASGDGQIILWDVATLDTVVLLNNPDGVLYAAFSTDGTFILSQGYGLVRIWGIQQED